MNMQRLPATGLVLVALAASSAAGQAQTLRPHLDYATAAIMRDACLAWAGREKLTLAVAVYDREGVLITQAHMDEAPAGVGDLAQWKARSAAVFESKSSVTAGWGEGIPGLATLAGGVSFAAKDGRMLGGIGASGASPEQDEACSMAGVAAAGLIAQDTP